jgi:iron complex outermembrane receptor protein
LSVSRTLQQALRLSALLFLFGGVATSSRSALAEDSGEDSEDSGEDSEDSGESEESDRPALPEVGAQADVVDRKLQTLDEANHTSPASSVVLDVDHEAIAPSTSVADFLDSVAGVHVRRFGGPGDPAYVRIRGATAQQVEVFVDGVPLNGHGTWSVDLSEIDLAAFDRVVVYRGFVPAALGGSPLGGAVHLMSRPEASVPARFSARFGSWSTRALQASGGLPFRTPTGAPGSVRLSAHYSGTEGNYRFFSNKGTSYNLTDDRMVERSNNDSNQLGVSGRVRVVDGPVDVSASDVFFWREGGEPGHSGAQTLHARLGVLDNLLGSQLSLRFNPQARLRGRLSWRVRQERYEDSFDEVGVGSQLSEDLYHQAQAGLLGDLQPTDWLRVTPSARLALDTYTPISLLGGRSEDGTRIRVAGTLGIEAEFSPWEGRLTVVPGVALTLLDNRFLGTVPFQEIPIVSDGDELAFAVMPRVAMAARPWDFLTVRASLQRGFRPPTFSELFGDRGGVIGNASLRPESGTAADIGVRLLGAVEGKLKGGLEVGGFFSDTQDAIVFLPNSRRMAVPTNIGRTRIGGVELAGSAELFGHLSLSGSATWTQSEIIEGSDGSVGNQVPFVPEWQLHGGLDFHWGHWVRLGYRFDFVAGTFDSASNFFEQAPRANHSLHVRLQPGPKMPWLSVEVNNIADRITAVAYRDPLHPAEDDRAVVAVEDFRGNPLSGRAIFATIGWTYPGSPAAKLAAEGSE